MAQKPGLAGPWLKLAALGVLSLALLYGAWSYAYYAVFSAFMQYDDEGYLLITQKMFFQGHPLYDRVYTQYGPFYYLYYWLLWIAGIAEPTHDSGRFVTIAHWLVASAGFGWLALRVTGRYWAACLAFLATVLHLTPMRFEPSHTQGLVIAQIGVFAVLLTLQRGVRLRLALGVALGVLAGVIAATKINTGALVYLALICGGWVALEPSVRSRWPGVDRILALLIGAGAIAFPFVLMRQNILAAPWALHYAVVASSSIAAFVALVFPRDRHRLCTTASFSFAVVMHASLAGGIALSLAFAYWHGSSLTSMWEHLITKALAFPTVFKLPPSAFTLATSVCALVALANAIAWRLVRDRAPEAMAGAMAATKIVVACAFFALSVPVEKDPATAWFAPWLWLVVAIEPPREQGRAAAYWMRVMLAALAAFMLLYAYPVFATQGAIATATLAPLFSIVLYDGIAETGRLLERSPLTEAARRAGGTALTALVILSYTAAAEYQGFRKMYFENEPLSLPGMHHVRLHRALATEIRWLVENLRAHADTFVSLPGLNSFYLWAQMEPPTASNAGSWSYLLDDSRQKEIIHAIETRKDVCAIVAPQIERLWYAGGEPRRTALVEFIDTEFRPLVESVHYSFRIRKDRDAASLYIALLNDSLEFEPDHGALAMPQDFVPAEPPFTIELRFVTESPGALIGMQTRDHPEAPKHQGWRPLLYVGLDGRLRSAPLEGGEPVVASNERVVDGAIHHAAVVVTDSAWILYLDGHRCGTGPVPEDVTDERYWQLGDAYTTGFPEAPDGWFPFKGTISSARLWRHARSDAEIAHAASELHSE